MLISNFLAIGTIAITLRGADMRPLSEGPERFRNTHSLLSAVNAADTASGSQLLSIFPI
jgi:hypothetical protein